MLASDLPKFVPPLCRQPGLSHTGRRPAWTVSLGEAGALSHQEDSPQAPVRKRVLSVISSSGPMGSEQQQVIRGQGETLRMSPAPPIMSR